MRSHLLRKNSEKFNGQINVVSVLEAQLHMRWGLARPGKCHFLRSRRYFELKCSLLAPRQPMVALRLYSNLQNWYIIKECRYAKLGSICSTPPPVEEAIPPPLSRRLAPPPVGKNLAPPLPGKCLSQRSEKHFLPKCSCTLRATQWWRSA